MANYYCKYCGARAPSVSELTSSPCTRHPLGIGKRHELYEGSEKKRYTCKYCGGTFPSISNMTSCACIKHPNGPNRGKHSPAL